MESLVLKGLKMGDVNETLFWDLFNCKSEIEVQKLIQTNKYLNNNDNWIPYGGKDRNNKSNFAEFEGQQANPIPALVEKITNSIDSLLMKKCRISGIDPESNLAPCTMKDAVERYFKIKDGDFSEVSQDDRRNIALDIQIVATGEKGQQPNILVFDNGEGQHPDDFYKTFLSLRSGNKTKIQFVQGKYNMGSTGAVIFCGDLHYQLICSKQSRELNERKDDIYGFTLVREHPLTPTEETLYKSSWHEYFVINDQVPRFSSKPLDIGLWKKSFDTGSMVKLYSYSLPAGSRSSIVWDLWRDLNQYLYQPALPFLLYESRKEYDQKTPSKTVLGNKTRLSIDEREKVEKIIPLSFDNSEIGHVEIDVMVFKQDVNQKEFINKKPVIFTINGQVHGDFSTSFISTELGFPLLKYSMLVHVDCTRIKTTFRKNLFKASRDRMNESSKTESLKQLIINNLRSNETLKEIHQNRKNSILHENKSDTGLIKDIISKLPIEKDLLDMLKNSGDLQVFNMMNKTENRKDTEERDRKKNPNKGPHTSNRFPSIFKINIDPDQHGKRIKTVPLNGKGVVKFETDVEDEYLFRPKDKGALIIQILTHGVKSKNGSKNGLPTEVADLFEVIKAGPTDNSIRVTFAPKNNVEIGDEFEVNAKLTSPDGDLECMFYIKIIDSQKEPENKKTEKNKKDSPSLPMPIKVFEKNETDALEQYATWDKYGWTGEDIVLVIEGNKIESGMIPIEGIAINMDSYVLKRYLSKNQLNEEKQIKFVKDKYFLQVYLHSLFLYSILSKMEKNASSPDEGAVEKISKIFKVYAPFLLSVENSEAILKAFASE